MKYYEALARAFQAEGTECAFSLMGDATMHFQMALRAGGARVIDARHEAAALNMADGYSRATGRVGVCMVTKGPGLTQLATPLLVARRHGAPVVIFCGIPPEAPHHQHLDQQRFLDGCETPYVVATGEERAAAVVRRAFEMARGSSRPVVLAASKQVQCMEATHSQSLPSGRVVATPVYGASKADVAAAVAAVELASRPVIVAGRGACRAGAIAEIKQFGTLAGAPIATTFLGLGHFSDYAPNLGIAGGFSFPATEQVFAKADLVIAIGTSLDELTTQDGRLFKAPILRIDHGKPNGGEALFISADAGAAVEQINAELPKRKDRNRAWRDEIHAILEGDPRQDDFQQQPSISEGGAVDPRRLMMALDDQIPPDAIIVVGGGHSMAFPAMFLSQKRRTFIPSYSFGAIGQTFPTSIGVAAAGAGRPVVGFEGDGGFMMHLQEIDTAVRERIDLVFVVMNDEALGAEFHHLRSEGIDPTAALVRSPHLDRVTDAFGGQGYRIDDEGGMAVIAAQAFGQSGFRLIDARISRSVESRRVRERREGTGGAARH
jgi:thiamine pyrophosphate-dependent acetolactate synthase large subunit-like protein